MLRLLAALVVVLVPCAAQSAASSSPAPPSDWFAPLKNIHLGPKVLLSLGGETRQRFEFFNNDEWGLKHAGADGFYLQRYHFNVDLRVGSRFRFFGQLKSNLAAGRAEGPRPVDADRVDVHQAFAEIVLIPKSSAGEWTLRLGRQESPLGSSRLVSLRDGPNVRLSFDGARLMGHIHNWNLNLLALRPARTRAGSFDDTPDNRQSLWGLYATNKLAALPGATLDLYYLGLDRKRARFHSGTGREQRHSFGARFSRRQDAWDLDYEGVLQSGTFAAPSGGQGIRAWTTGTNSGYTFLQLPGKPRIGTKANVTSGDRNPNDRRLNTFNALFPKGNYFSQADLLGPYNLMDLHPSISVKLRPEVTLTQDFDLFWRYSTRDGLYDVPGNPIVPGTGSNARFIGHAFKTGLEWKYDAHLSFEAEYQRLLSGSFLRQQGRPNTIDFFALWATFRF